MESFSGLRHAVIGSIFDPGFVSLPDIRKFVSLVVMGFFHAGQASSRRLYHLFIPALYRPDISLFISGRHILYVFRKFHMVY